YLQAEGLQPAAIKGVVGVSGVYRIPVGKTDVLLGGTSPRALRWDEMAPFRSPNAKDPSWIPDGPGIPLSMNVFGFAFGDDPKIRDAASPVQHVRPGLPPFLLLHAEKDLPLLP